MSATADGFDEFGGPAAPSDDLAAAEYVLGVLEAGPRLAAQARIASDRPFADLVSAWERRLAPLALDVRPAEVPSRVWTRIQERLGWTTPAAPADGAPRNLFWWRLTAGIAATAALALLAVDIVPHWNAAKVAKVATTSSEPPFTQVTTLALDDGSPGWLATVDARRGTVLMVPVPRAPDAEGRAAELWLIPPGQAPRSLGAVSVDRAHRVVVPAKWRADLREKSVLAITLEAASGIPHTAPTGPIIAKGAIQL